MSELIVFYDSQCPLCRAELDHLKKFDRDRLISLEDLHAPNFADRFPFIDVVKANRVLHGQLANGEMIYGLDVTVKAWGLVNKYRWLKVLRWPLMRTVSDLFYKIFARYRNQISALLLQQKQCDRCK